MSEHNKFLALEYRDVEITRNGETETFRCRELSGAAASKVFDLQKPNGKRDPAKVRNIDSRVIAASVTTLNDDGSETKITKEEADAFGTGLRRQLMTVALEVNGIGDDFEAKND